nr:hypothetical protein [uncultured Methanomethylovorans sp.]
MESEKPEGDRPNMVDRFFIGLGKPHNLARILRWAWLLSLFLLAMGYILIYLYLSGKLDI